MNASGKLLIIDDDKATCELLSEVFASKGYMVHCAGYASDALNIISNGGVDAALIDVRLPDMDGTALLKRIKSEFPDIACMVITGSICPESAIEALKEGAYDYFVKPLPIREVLKRVKEAVDRQALQRELKESEERFRSLVNDVLDSSRVGIFILDKTYTVVWANKALLKYFGLRRDEVVGINMATLIKSRLKTVFEQPDAYEANLLESYEKGVFIENAKFRVMPGDGRKERWLQHWSQPIKTGLYRGGRIDHYMDITEHKKKEEELMLLHTAINTTRTGITIRDIDGRIRFTNPADAAMHGYSVSELIGRDSGVFALHGTENKLTVDQLRSMTSWTREGVNVKKDGSLLKVKLTSDVVKDDSGNPIGLVMVCEDMTDPKKAEERKRRDDFAYYFTRLCRDAASVEPVYDVALFWLSKLLSLSTVSVWTVSNEEGFFKCEKLYNATKGKYTALGPINLSDIKTFLSLMKRDMPLVLVKANGDDRLGELYGAYIRPNCIESLICMPFKYSDKLAGALLLGHSGAMREWSTEDVDFASMVADQISIAIEKIKERDLHEADLRQYAVTLEGKVQERTEELRNALLQAESANRAKSDFLANMSHELRTPLNTVIGFAELIIRGVGGPLTERQIEYVNDIKDSGSHLLSLINDILDLSKVEADKLQPEMEEFSVRELLEGSLSIFKEKAMRHRILLSFAAEGDLGIIRADRRRIKQAVYNLLSNAVKFTPDGGSAGIRARRVAGAVEVEVWDTGIGIAKDEMGRLFEPFVRLDNAVSKGYEGTGLGLSLTKKMILLHGGDISVESKSGAGTIFKFRLPDAQ